MLDQRFGDRPFPHLVAGHAAKAMGDADTAARRCGRALALQPTSARRSTISWIWAASGSMTPRAGRFPPGRTGRTCESRTGSTSSSPPGPGCWSRPAKPRPPSTTTAPPTTSPGRALAGHGIRHDADAAEQQLEADLADWRLAEQFERPLPSSGIDLTPVFVTGLPRSGTTLVEQVLASHPEVRAGGELTLGPRGSGTRLPPTAGPRASPTPLPPAGGHRGSAAESAARPATVPGRPVRARARRRWVVDKLPANARIAGFLRLLFPDAPIVHCRRRSARPGLVPVHGELRRPRGLVPRPGRHGGRVPAPRAGGWPTGVPCCRLRSRRSPTRNWCAIRRRGSPSCSPTAGFPFDPACLHPEALDRPVFTASHAQVRRPIHTGAIDRWRPQARHLVRFDPAED
ncbi:MAG: sulfotransferase [Gammaproteobacteria bacterium]|nr:sulfotransferase [Gammaproteobacteria bacterium]